VGRYRPRLSIDLTMEQYSRFIRLVPYGSKGRLLVKVLDVLLDTIEKHGDLAIGAILSDKVSVIDLLKVKEAQSGNDTSSEE